MDSKISKEQKDLLEKVGIPFNIPEDLKDLSSSQRADLEDLVGDYLTLHCLNENYDPNAEGLICEDILDIIGNM